MSGITLAEAKALSKRLRAAAEQVNGQPILQHILSVLAKPPIKSHEPREERRRRAGR